MTPRMRTSRAPRRITGGPADMGRCGLKLEALQLHAHQSLELSLHLSQRTSRCPASIRGGVHSCSGLRTSPSDRWICSARRGLLQRPCGDAPVVAFYGLDSLSATALRTACQPSPPSAQCCPCALRVIFLPAADTPIRPLPAPLWHPVPSSNPRRRGVTARLLRFALVQEFFAESSRPASTGNFCLSLAVCALFSCQRHTANLSIPRPAQRQSDPAASASWPRPLDILPSNLAVTRIFHLCSEPVALVRLQAFVPHRVPEDIALHALLVLQHLLRIPLLPACLGMERGSGNPQFRTLIHHGWSVLRACPASSLFSYSVPLHAVRVDELQWLPPPLSAPRRPQQTLLPCRARLSRDPSTPCSSPRLPSYTRAVPRILHSRVFTGESYSKSGSVWCAPTSFGAQSGSPMLYRIRYRAMSEDGDPRMLRVRMCSYFITRVSFYCRSSLRAILIPVAAPSPRLCGPRPLQEYVVSPPLEPTPAAFCLCRALIADRALWQDGRVVRLECRWC
ncbi:hypothetical protein FB451DRAFT_1536783 [Mycena latifolia]|nr:hypothetical protein FB451DRAFT_1465768 [Mycena latifolia]KAJ7447018.1 hypothetical protein FB451DRAFT_1536783 [Mycena latifolia]